MNYRKETPEKIELVKHGGCEECVKRCQYNGRVASPEVAARTKGIMFDCNSIKAILECIRLNSH